MRMLVVGNFHGKLKEGMKKKILSLDYDLILGLGDYAGIDDWRPYINFLFKEKSSKPRDEWLSAEEFFGKKEFNRIMDKDLESGKKVLSFFNNLGKPFLFIFGNGDEDWYKYPFGEEKSKLLKSRLKFTRTLKNSKDITYKRINRNGVSFFCFGGYMDVLANHSNKDGSKGDKENYQKAIKRLKKSEIYFRRMLSGKKGGIFILHYPPKGVFDRIVSKGNPYHGKSAGIEFFRKDILKVKPALVLVGHMHEYQGKQKLGNSLIVNPGHGAEGKFAIVDFDEVNKKVRDVGFYGD